MAPDPEAAAVDVAVWYDAGSRHDKPGKTGVAQLFERLMFAGSTRFALNEHSRLIRAEGGSSGSYSAPDFTCFYQTLPPDALDLAFRLEADRMTGLQLSQEVLDRERKRAEMDRARQSSSISRGIERLYAEAYAAHPYRRPIHGSASERARVTLQDCLDFYRRRYGPRNAVVTVVGKFDPEQAAAMARERFGRLKSTGAAEPTRKETEPPQNGERRVQEAAPVTVRVLMGAWRMPARSDPDWAAANLLSIVLGRGSTSRLARALTDEGLCLSVQAGMNTRRTSHSSTSSGRSLRRPTPLRW